MPSLRFPDGIIESFDKLNTSYFGGSLWHPVFALSDGTPGQYGWYSRQGGVAFIALTPLCLEQTRDVIEDVLLHEMVHHAVATIEERAHDGVHGLAFADFANAIGARMGLPPVLPESEEAEHWPRSLRVSGQYRATA